MNGVDTYPDFTVFNWNHSGKSITISEVYLFKSSSVEFEFDAFGKGTVNKSKLTATGGLTYDPSTGVLSSDGTAGSLVLEFATPVDMRNLFQFNVANSGQTGDILSRLEFYDEDDTKINTWNSIKLSNMWNAAGIDNGATNAFLNHNPVKKMVWPSDAKAENNGKTATITSVEFYCKTIACVKAGETQLNTLDYFYRATNEAEWSKVTPTWGVAKATDTYYGDGSSKMTHYVDLTDYSELRIYRDNKDEGFRAFFFTGSGDTGADGIEVNKDNSAVSWNATNKCYVIDLTKITPFNEKVWLIAIKSSGWNVKTIVNNIVVYNTPAANAPKYSLSGSGMQLAETVAALADATATCIDATGVTGITTDSEAGRTLLTSANPNCLFLGTTGNGALANTQNVVTSGTCANLVLTDGANNFNAPVDFTATSVSYNRTFTENQPSTVCLPFELTAEQVTEAGTFYELTGYSDNTLTFSEVATTEAYKPYLFKAAKANPFTSYSGKAVGETPTEIEDLSVSVAEGAATMTGTMARQSVNGKYGWNSVGGAFSKATSDEVTIDPFRAYITISGGGLARVAARFVDNSVTGINEVSETQNVLNPDRKYIENGKIVIVKNGVKYNAAGQLLK